MRRDCGNSHLYGLAAIVCIDDRARPVKGWFPVQRCDMCAVFDGDVQAAQAVALMTGTKMMTVNDEQGRFLQAFVSAS